MRFLLKYKVKNGTTLNFIVEASHINDARKKAIEMSQAMFKGGELEINENTLMIHSERWAKSKTIKYIPGNKNFNTAFFNDEQLSVVSTDGEEVKGAYNNILSKCGIQENIDMVICETGQLVNRREAVNKAKKILANKLELSELVRSTITTFRGTEEIQAYWPDFNELLVLLKEYKNRQYVNIDIAKMELLVAVMLYICNPRKYSLESHGCEDVSSAIQMITNELNHELNEYKKWLACGESLQ